MENEIFEEIYLYLICSSKAIKISLNQHAGLLRFLFAAVPLKVKKNGVEVVSRPLFYRIFFFNYFVMLHKLAKFH